MSPTKLPTIWPAKPHTIAKMELLKAYLNAWFPIMGRSMIGRDLVYIDGFAGPGYYTNHPEGSPTAALAVIRSVLASTGSEWRAGRVHCLFIDEDGDRCAHLEAQIAPYYGLDRVRVYPPVGCGKPSRHG